MNSRDMLPKKKVGVVLGMRVINSQVYKPFKHYTLGKYMNCLDNIRMSLIFTNYSLS